MELNFSVIGNATGVITFSLLSAYMLNSNRRRATDNALIAASIISALWLALLCLQGYGFEISFTLRYSFELIRTGAWFVLLYSILGVTLVPKQLKFEPQLIFSAGVIFLLSLMIVLVNIQQWIGYSIVAGRTLLILNVVISLIGILLLEQIWRNSALFTRASIKYLSLAVATILAYDFIMYSDALLFSALSDSLWEARGAVNALATLLIAFTLKARKDQPLGIHISRQMVFHTTTFVIAGVYLIFVSAGGYYINVFGGTWGAALRILFIFTAGIFLILVISSPNLRARTMVFISKNFFDYKYDYRDEWIQSTESLQSRDTEDSLALRSTKTLAALIQAQAGAIWIRDEDDNYAPRAQFGFTGNELEKVDHDADLVSYFGENDWIINLVEYLADPEKYDLIELPDAILKSSQPWLIVPLKINKRLSGFVFLAQPYVPLDLNWENYDLLKIVAQQACSYLEQQGSEELLAQSRQFEAVNQTSAFLIHDLKTIIAQLSLLVKNAPKHKHNPDFVDDMIHTTQHSVEKIEHLLTQIRNPNQKERIREVDLCDLLAQVCHEKRNSNPAPKLILHNESIQIEADPKQLASVIEHMTQNAIEACNQKGSVEISTKTSSSDAFIFIQDSGAGMTQEFIQNELFKPFSSTKGLTGMGIGAYQSREYLRKLGGTISVTSEPNLGTCFTLKIPRIKTASQAIETKEALS